MIALALSLALASPIQDFPSGSGELVVERVDGSEPLRLNVRSSSAPARILLGEVARVASLKLTDVPEELAGSVGPVALRDVPRPARSRRSLGCSDTW